jgi:hypothetical protein
MTVNPFRTEMMGEEILVSRKRILSTGEKQACNMWDPADKTVPGEG